MPKIKYIERRIECSKQNFGKFEVKSVSLEFSLCGTGESSFKRRQLSRAPRFRGAQRIRIAVIILFYFVYTTLRDFPFLSRTNFHAYPFIRCIFSPSQIATFHGVETRAAPRNTAYPHTAWHRGKAALTQTGLNGNENNGTPLLPTPPIALAVASATRKKLARKVSLLPSPCPPLSPIPPSSCSFVLSLFLCVLLFPAGLVVISSRSIKRSRSISSRKQIRAYHRASRLMKNAMHAISLLFFIVFFLRVFLVDLFITFNKM